MAFAASSAAATLAERASVEWDALAEAGDGAAGEGESTLLALLGGHSGAAAQALLAGLARVGLPQDLQLGVGLLLALLALSACCALRAACRWAYGSGDNVRSRAGGGLLGGPGTQWHAVPQYDCCSEHAMYNGPAIFDDVHGPVPIAGAGWSESRGVPANGCHPIVAVM
eukprot:6365397-Prymnesium_polylepis.1